MAKAKTTVGIEGLEELRQAFKAINVSVETRGHIKAVKAGGDVILEAAQANIRATFENQTGFLEDSGHVEIGFRGNWSQVVFDAVYSAVHEYGLENQVITARQRRFFWAMWHETKDEMWKALALSQTYTIPARPYLRPAVDSTKVEVAQAMAKAYRAEIRKAAKKRSAKLRRKTRKSSGFTVRA